MVLRYVLFALPMVILSPLLAPQSGAAASSVPQGVRKAIQMQYDRQGAVARAKSPLVVKSFIEDTTTPDCLFVDRNGHTMNRKQLLAFWMDQAAHTTSIQRWDNKIKSLSLRKGGIATIMISSNQKWTITDGNGQTHRMVNRGTSQDTWVKTPAGWKLKRGQELSIRTLMDGKPFSP